MATDASEAALVAAAKSAAHSALSSCSTTTKASIRASGIVVPTTPTLTMKLMNWCGRSLKRLEVLEHTPAFTFLFFTRDDFTKSGFGFVFRLSSRPGQLVASTYNSSGAPLHVLLDIRESGEVSINLSDTRRVFFDLDEAASFAMSRAADYASIALRAGVANPAQHGLGKLLGKGMSVFTHYKPDPRDEAL